MIDPDNLDPVEVLLYLKELGCKNISDRRLHEFMTDLKKLIKYEQQQLMNLGYTYDIDQSNRSACPQDERPNTSRRKQENTSNQGESSSLSSSALWRHCAELLGEDAIRELTSRSDSDIRKKKLVAFGEQSTSKDDKTPPSFIRPWRLQPTCKRPGNRTSLKSDPVQLYHKYKELWEQQKVPGEKNHSQLRWNIREKMLGQDPHPRPVSQPSSECFARSTKYV